MRCAARASLRILPAFQWQGRSDLKPSLQLETRIRENRTPVSVAGEGEEPRAAYFRASMILLKPSAVALVTGSWMEVRRLGRCRLRIFATLITGRSLPLTA